MSALYCVITLNWLLYIHTDHSTHRAGVVEEKTRFPVWREMRRKIRKEERVVEDEEMWPRSIGLT